MKLWKQFTSKFDSKGSKKEFLYLWILCVVGSLSLVPYIHHLSALSLSSITFKELAYTFVYGGFFYGVILWVSYYIIKPTDLGPFRKLDLKKGVFYPALVAGIALAFFILLSKKALFSSSMNDKNPSLILGTIASLFGAINEEVLLRLFGLSLVYLAINKFLKMGKLKALWLANILVALVFGLAHLPVAFKIWDASSSDLLRVLLLNGTAGVVFGYLYFSRNLLTAMIAHFITNFLVFGVFA